MEARFNSQKDINHEDSVFLSLRWQQFPDFLLRLSLETLVVWTPWTITPDIPMLCYSRLGHMTWFCQWDISKDDANRDLICACMLRLVLLALFLELLPWVCRAVRNLKLTTLEINKDILMNSPNQSQSPIIFQLHVDSWMNPGKIKKITPWTQRILKNYDHHRFWGGWLCNYQ